VAASVRYPLMPLIKARGAIGRLPACVLAVGGLDSALGLGRRYLPLGRCERESLTRPEAWKVNGVLTDDERFVVGAAYQLGLIL
jgi:hypothetical protein